MEDKQIDIELPQEVAYGQYSNLAIVTHSGSEFVLDFVNMMPNTPKAKVQSRIILSPDNVKRLIGALIENVERYEAAFGPIEPKEPVLSINAPDKMKIN